VAAFCAVFTFGGCGPALTAHGSFDLKIHIQMLQYTRIQEYKKLYSSPIEEIHNVQLQSG
jgi:hypothetical protein